MTDGRFGICAFGLAYGCGIVWAGTELANPNPFRASHLLRIASAREMAFVELPPSLLPSSEPEELRAFRAEADALGLGVVVASGLAEVEPLRRDLRIANELGAKTVRCILSRVLCGDRRNFPGGWYEHVARCRQAFAEVLPEAERLGITIALENHQDLDSTDLLELCRHFESPFFGVTLDTGNPLAVMEDPVEFATAVGPYLRHVHLKDYRVYPAPNGVRLVRCAAGAGVIDFPGILRVCEEQTQPITLSLEQGALQARQIPFAEATWWDEFQPRTGRSLAGPLAVLLASLRSPEEDYRTPYERGDAPAVLAEYEWTEFEESVAYFKGLSATS